MKEVLRYLPSEAREYDVVPVYASRHRGFRACDNARWPFISNIAQIVHADAYLRPGAGDVFLALDLATHVLPRHARQIKRWKRAGAKIAIVVYDLLPLLHPDFFTDKAVENHKFWFRFLHAHADVVCCISAHVDGMVREALAKMGSHNAHVWHFSLGYDFSHMEAAKIPPAPLPAQATHSRFVLMVGTLEPRKSYDTALDAFELMWRERGDAAPSLVIAGRPGWKSDRTQHRIRLHPHIDDKLFWIENADDMTLGQLYDRADLLLVTSVAEGFGLPLVEAAARDLPVLARDLPVFREIMGGHASYFDRDDPATLRQAVIAEIERANATAKAGRRYLVTWEEATRQLVRKIGFAIND